MQAEVERDIMQREAEVERQCKVERQRLLGEAKAEQEHLCRTTSLANST